MLLLKKYGTDFHILSNFFPKKTKNQLKVIANFNLESLQTIFQFIKEERKRGSTKAEGCEYAVQIGGIKILKR